MRRCDLHTHLAPAIPGEPIGPPDLRRPDKLLRYLDGANLDVAVVSIPPPYFRQRFPVDEARQWVRSLNDGLFQTVATHDRLIPLAYLPLEHPELALEEYIRTNGAFAGVVGSAGGQSMSLADSRFAPLWNRIDRDNGLLMLHPGATPDSRLKDFYLDNLLGNPSETAVATAQLVFGNVLSRFPGMRVLLVHCGGTVPSIVGRWQKGADTARPGVDPSMEPPAEAVRRMYVDCLAHDPAVVDLAVSVFGEDKLVLGSDWPFPMGCNNPISLVAHRGSEFVRRAATENAGALLG